MTRNDRSRMAMLRTLSALALSSSEPAGIQRPPSEPIKPRTDKHRNAGHGSNERQRRMRQLERRRRAEAPNNQAAA